MSKILPISVTTTTVFHFFTKLRRKIYLVENRCFCVGFSRGLSRAHHALVFTIKRGTRRIPKTSPDASIRRNFCQLPYRILFITIRRITYTLSYYYYGNRGNNENTNVHGQVRKSHRKRNDYDGVALFVPAPFTRIFLSASCMRRHNENELVK